MEKGNSTGEPRNKCEGLSWTTLRTNYWKEQASMPDAEELWSEDNIRKMLKGRSPIKNGQKIILHHPEGRKNCNIKDFVEMPENEHRAFHKENGYHYDEEHGWH